MKISQYARFFVLFSVFIVPFLAQAQGKVDPVAECSITKPDGIAVQRWKVFKPPSGGIFPPPPFWLYRDNNNDGIWTHPGERVPTAIFPPGASDENKITIPQNALSTGAVGGPWKDIKIGDVLPHNWSIFCLLNTVYTITNWVYIIILALAVGLVALAGFFWITSGADPNQQKRARAMLSAAVLGFLIALLAKFIPGLITGILF